LKGCDRRSQPTSEQDANTRQLVKDLKSWKEGWEDILKGQYEAAEAFANLYKSIEPIDHEQPHRPVPTPTKYMNKCLALQKIYAELARDLQQEVNMVQNRLVTPAEQAREHLKPLKKTLKHRENTKLDYERYLGRTEHAQKKQTRSMKEEAALAKHESDLAQAHVDYQNADDQIKETFPPLTAAVIALLPQMMALQIRIQTTLVGQYYTILDQYTKQHGLPNPAPSNAEIVAVHDREFAGLRKELESGLLTVANGKAVNMPMALPEKDGSTISGYGIRNKIMSKKPSQQKLAPSRPAIGAPDPPLQLKATAEHDDYDDEGPPPVKPPRPSQKPSYGMPSPAMPSYGMSSPAMPSYGQPSPAIPTSTKPRIPSTSVQAANPPPYSEKPSQMLPNYSNAGSPNQAYSGATPPSYSGTPSNTLSNSDYFSQQQEKARRPSASSAVSAASIAAKKKKPPPPVPTKRLPSVQQAQYVTAIFDFEGQAEGDLSFRDGDRIRIVKKTESIDDWWDGEINGITGCFPANYVRMG
jgi:amphiphysin